MSNGDAGRNFLQDINNTRTLQESMRKPQDWEALAKHLQQALEAEVKENADLKKSIVKLKRIIRTQDYAIKHLEKKDAPHSV